MCECDGLRVTVQGVGFVGLPPGRISRAPPPRPSPTTPRACGVSRFRVWGLLQEGGSLLWEPFASQAGSCEDLVAGVAEGEERDSISHPTAGLCSVSPPPPRAPAVFRGSYLTQYPH